MSQIKPDHYKRTFRVPELQSRRKLHREVQVGRLFRFDFTLSRPWAAVLLKHRHVLVFVYVTNLRCFLHVAFVQAKLDQGRRAGRYR